MKTTNKFLNEKQIESVSGCCFPGLLAVVLACLMPQCQAASTAIIGQVQFAYGNVNVTSSGGVSRPLTKGDSLSEGDSITTAVASSAQIRMLDGGLVAIRPDTKMKFDKFVFNGKQDGSEREFFTVVKGGFRAVTGLIGMVNKKNYKITTPSATIGIRGTDHETFVVPEGSKLAAAGAYSKVNVGETTLTTNKGTINVMPNQMGFAAGMDQAPRIQPINMHIFTVSATPTKTIKESKPENDKQVSTGDKQAKSGDTHDAAGDKQEQQSAARNGAKETDSAGDVRTTSAMDNSKAVTASNVAPVVTTAPPVSVLPAGPVLPITAENGTQSINASNQTVTSGGSTVSVQNAPALVPSAAYAANHVAVETASLFASSARGSMAVPADLVYVTGTAGGTSSSGALSSMTFRDFGGGAGYVSTSTITGITATSANAPAGIQYGAWTVYTGQTDSWTMQLGAQQKGNGTSSWMYGPQGYLDTPTILSAATIGGVTGVFAYQMDGANAPHSTSSGLNGSVTSATFTVNFLTMQLNGNLAITMPGSELWGASLTNLAITATGATFFSGNSPGAVAANSPLIVIHGIGTAAACTTCFGNVSGALTGQNFAGAILSYNLYDNAQQTGGDVSGNVAFTRVGVTVNPPVTNGTAAPTGNIVAATSSNGSSANINTYPAASATTTGNVLTAFTSSGAAPNTFTQSTTINCPNATCPASTPAGQVASSGIYYGNWIAGSITQTSSMTTTAANSVVPSYWITGPEAGPLYLPQALTGTATFAFNAGQVSNGMGVAGAVQGTTALTLDFNKQTVGINLDVKIADTATSAVHTWNAKTALGQEAALGNGQGIGGAAFHASTFTNNGGGSGLLTITVDTGATAVTNATGNINGQLTGTGLTGAIMSFNLGGALGATAAPSFENINGVAAFTGTAANIATPHRYVSMSFYDPFAAVPRPALGFYANAETPIATVGAKMDAKGQLTQFDTQFVNNNGGNNSTTLANSTGTLTDHGSDSLTGISWGRWSSGTFTVTDRATGLPTTVTNSGSLHWIAEPVATSAVTLPISGSYTYTKVGGTQPTDNLGNVGTLNSTTLAANFTANTVNLGVNTTVNGATLDAKASNVPIIQKTVFYASSQEPASSTSYLTVACTGTCGTATGGTVIGKFTGAGAIGVAMTYGLQNGSSTISGVAAFRRTP